MSLETCTKKLGFGLMRLPMCGDEVDIEQTKQMVDLFLDAGFTYFDTAYGYLDGKSEQAVKTALVDRHPRSSFLLATKLPAWAGAKTKQEAEAMLETSLARTGAGYFDFYLLHNLGDDRIRIFEEYDIWNFVRRKKEEGILRHIGFSFHDKADVLDRLLTEHPEVDFVQIQINYVDWESPSIQSRLCYETARRHGKPVIIMEPVKGGNLASPPAPIDDLFRAHNPDASPSSWAIRFAASLPGVITVLSGMSNLAQMRDNISYMKEFRPLDSAEQEVIGQVRAAFDALPTVPCTACGYCLRDCPRGVGIPTAFRAVNQITLYGNEKTNIWQYHRFLTVSEKNPAADCIGCGRCEQVCPQHIQIRKEFERAAAMLDREEKQ